MIAFLAKISIVFAASTLLFYLIAVVNRKLAKMIRNKAEESEHAWTEEESNPCHDDICFFCGKDIDEWSIFVQHMHRAVSAEMTTPMNLSTVYEDKVVSIPCCEGCLAANKVADAKANRNTWIVALLAFAAVFAALMYLFHGHSGAWLVAAAHALLAGIVVHSVAGWIAKPAYRKKIEENPVVAELRGKTWKIGAAPCEKLSIEPEVTTPMEQEKSLNADEVGTISLNDVCVAFKDWKSNPFFIGEYIPDDLKCFVAQETGCSEDDVLAVYGKSPEKGTPWFAVLRCGLALRADTGIGVERQVMYLPWTSIWYISFDDRNSGIPSCLYISNFPKNAPYKSGVIDLQHLSKSDMELVYNSLRWLAEASDDGSTHWTRGWRRCLRVWTTKYSFIPEPNQVWPIWSHFD